MRSVSKAYGGRDKAEEPVTKSLGLGFWSEKDESRWRAFEISERVTGYSHLGVDSGIIHAEESAALLNDTNISQKEDIANECQYKI